MANREFQDDQVWTVPLRTVNAAGQFEPAPAGDVFTVTSDNPALGVAIGTMSDGTSTAVVFTPMVQASTGITYVVSDSAGLAQFTEMVDIVPDVTPTNILLDFASAEIAAQAPPAAPGP